MKLEVNTKDIKADEKLGSPAGIEISISGKVKELVGSEIVENPGNKRNSIKAIEETVEKKKVFFVTSEGNELCIYTDGKKVFSHV